MSEMHNKAAHFGVSVTLYCVFQSLMFWRNTR